MTLLPKRFISATIVGDDLHAVALSVGPGSVRVAQRAVCPRFIALQPVEQSAALADLAQQPGELVFVAPTAWCALRLAQVTRAQWKSAAPGLLESIEQLFPIDRGEALLGMMNLYTSPSPTIGRPAGGALIAARRSRIQPTLDALEAALNRPASRALAAPMALLGLGLQRAPRAVALDADAHGEAIAHGLCWGLPTALDEPADQWIAADPDAEGDASAEQIVVLPGAAAPAGAMRVSAERLAIAGALALLAAPGAFVPLSGGARRAQPVWLAPLAAAAAAVALFVAGGQVWAGRLESASERARSAMASLEDQLARTQRLRGEAERADRLLREGVQATMQRWRSPLPVLREAIAALADQGFYYRVEVEEESVLLRGEAPSASALLQRLVGSPVIASAEFTAPVSKSSVSGQDVFEIRARRAAGEHAR